MFLDMSHGNPMVFFESTMKMLWFVMISTVYIKALHHGTTTLQMLFIVNCHIDFTNNYKEKKANKKLD